jgi:RNA polymerase sigma-70 factor (ECF subfamily)
VTEHYDFVYRSLRGLGVPTERIDDAAQQVFLVATKKVEAISVGSERAFFYATARGIAANVRRAELRTREVPDDDALASRADDSPDPEELVASKRAWDLVARVFGGLPPDDREVLVLFELEGMTMSAIASQLHVPSGTVASRLRRARAELMSAARRIGKRPS